jgi:hypothetical protein
MDRPKRYINSQVTAQASILWGAQPEPKLVMFYVLHKPRALRES